MNTEPVLALRINAPEWFAREDFRQFLERNGVATWHERGSEPCGYSEVFITYDHGEGSDYSDIPEDVWRAIDALCRRHGVEYGVVWIADVDQ